MLWLRGSFLAIDDWAVAVVGARRASPYGIDQAGRVARGLVEHGHSIVSGGARGVDAEAHRAALRAGGRTVAVLGSGLARPYPPEHRRLFDEMVAAGGVVLSEHPPTTEPRAAFFPRRNRIIAGLAIGVVLIEARARSGAAITARLAVEDLGREAMALPGRVDSPTSEGAHRAIREGWAALVTGPGDVVEHLRTRGAPRLLIEGVRRAAQDGGDEASEPIGAANPQRGLPPIPAQAARIGAILASSGRARLEELLEAAVGSAPALAADHAAHGPVDVGTVLAQLTLLEVMGLVARCDDGCWEARSSLHEVSSAVLGQVANLAAQPGNDRASRGPPIG